VRYLLCFLLFFLLCSGYFLNDFRGVSSQKKAQTPVKRGGWIDSRESISKTEKKESIDKKTLSAPPEKKLKVFEQEGRYKKIPFSVLTAYPAPRYGEEISFYLPHPLKLSEPLPLEPLPLAIPPEYLDLEGEFVVVEGYMIPLHFEGGRTRIFLLVPFATDCCFSEPPRWNDLIYVRGKEPFRVVPGIMLCKVYGLFRVGSAVMEDGFQSVYQLLAERVVPSGF
jgi:hypothetical protein